MKIRVENQGAQPHTLTFQPECDADEDQLHRILIELARYKVGHYLSRPPLGEKVTLYVLTKRSNVSQKNHYVRYPVPLAVHRQHIKDERARIMRKKEREAKKAAAQAAE